jgi:hypothetical protein
LAVYDKTHFALSTKDIGMPTEGKVVHIDRGKHPPAEVVINLGSENRIDLRSIVLIYVVSEEIVDPDTGASLGRLEKIRGRGKIRHVQAKMATVVPLTKKRQVTHVGSFSPNRIEEAEEEIPFDSDISVGDLVRVL